MCSLRDSLAQIVTLLALNLAAAVARAAFWLANQLKKFHAETEQI